MTTLAEATVRAESLAGVSVPRVSTFHEFRRHVLRYRQGLLGRLVRAWRDAAGGVYEFDVTAGGTVAGWGKRWGKSWGGGSTEQGAIPGFEAVWRIEARRASTQEWEPAYEVPATELGLDQPAVQLREGSLGYVDLNTVWLGTYDRVRVTGVRVPSLVVDPDVDDLAPNALIAPIYDLCLILEGARYLALLDGNLAVAGSLAADLREAEQHLSAQAASHADSWTTRRR